MRFRLTLLLAISCSLLLTTVSISAEKDGQAPLNLIVMDPLAKPLACDCVQGYAQREYEKLAGYLEEELGRPVQVAWGAALKIALEEEAVTGADVIIGKHSVVLSDAAQEKIDVEPVAALTGKDGSVTQTGLIVVRSADPAQSVGDLKDYRLFFGPKENDEKYAAPMALLKAAKVTIPEKVETFPACSDAATALMELDEETKAAAIISSYAEPLLEGCGSVKKGDLRVVGESEPVPFVTAFVNKKLSTAEQDQIRQALLDMVTQPKLLISLETSVGFVELEEEQVAARPAVNSDVKKKE